MMDRRMFPALELKAYGKDIAYLDNAATTHKPLKVIESIQEFYEKSNGNPHGGGHHLSIRSKMLYEEARESVKRFINVDKEGEIVFVKSATEALNMVAYSYGMNFIEEGDEIVISIMEHHSNLIPWQQVARAKKAELKYMYPDEEYLIGDDEINEKITERTKLVSVTHISNALGVINPIEKIVKRAHEVGAVVLVDLSQSVAHQRVDISELDADFAVFSAHKMFGPMGIGVLYGKKNILDKMPPFLYGGDMIEFVEEQSATFNELPYRLEAGTQNVQGAVGFKEAVDFIEQIDIEEIKRQEEEILEYARKNMETLDFVELYLPNKSNHASLISFNIKGVHPHDVATIMDSEGVAIRAGHHCCQPLMKHLNINATCRMSVAFYNTKDEIDRFIKGLLKVKEVFRI